MEPPVAQNGQTAAAAISYNADEMDSLVQSLEASASALPGGGVSAHRDAMHRFFDDVAKVLPVLEGPEQSGAFRQQLRTIEAARDRLNSEAAAASVDPAIHTGLRATSAALSRIGKDEDFSGQTLSDLLTKLDAKVDELDWVRAVGRPYIAADAGRLIAQVTRQMADRLAGRVTDAPTTTPVAEPAVAEPTVAEPAAPAQAPAAESAAPEAPQPEPKEKQKIFDILEEKTADAQPTEEKSAEVTADEKPAEEPPANDNK